MSLATELQKLKNLRDSDGITRGEYEASRNRLLEECVRKIESVHDRNPKVASSGRPSNASSPSAPAILSSETESPAILSRAGEAVSPNRPTAYSEELDYSLVKAPVRSSQVEQANTICAVAEQEVQSVPAVRVDAGPVASSQEVSVPKAKFSSPPPIEELDGSFFKNEPPVYEVPALHAVPELPARVAYETVKFVPSTERVPSTEHEENHQHVSQKTFVHQIEFSAPDDAGELDLSLVANVRGLPAFPSQDHGEEPDRSSSQEFAEFVDEPLFLRAAGPAVESVTAESEPEEAVPAPKVEIAAPIGGEFVPRFAAPEQSKIVEKGRWGLPRFKLVTGEVRDVRLSMCQNSDDYAASIALDGQRMEITSSSEIRIAPGDRVSLGGYERDGQLLVLGYRNETSGSHSDLARLRKRYRLLLTVGRLSLLVGLAAVAAAVMLSLHTPLWAAHFARWGYVPYALAALVGAAVSYLGLALSFVGRWAKEFYKALAPHSTKLVAENPPGALPATY
jgi:hypothetical protein